MALRLPNLVAPFLWGALALSASPGFAQTPTLYSWSGFSLNGGAKVTGLAPHPLAPYQVFARTATGGLFRFDRGRAAWTSLTDWFGPEERESQGVESVAVDRSRSSRVFMAAPKGRILVQDPQYGTIVRTRGEVFVSDNAGATWSSTGMRALSDPVEMEGGGYMAAETGERIAYDSTGLGTIYFASRYDGLLRRRGTGAWERLTNGLPSPESLPGIPNGLGGQFKAGYSFVLVDDSLRALSPSPPVFVGVYGRGVYRSRDGGTTWVQVTSRPDPVRADISTTGTVVVSHSSPDWSTGALLRIDAFGVADITPAATQVGGSKGFAGVACDPNDDGVVVVQSFDGWGLSMSRDKGSTWTRLRQSESLMSSDRPGYFKSFAGNASRAALAFDPVDGGVWQSNEFGIVRSTAVDAFAPGWRWEGAGLETMIVYDMAVPRRPRNELGAEIFVGARDSVGIVVASESDIPSYEAGSTVGRLSEATGVDATPSLPDTMVFVAGDDDLGSPGGGVSQDGGVTFEAFASYPSGNAQGGRVALSANDANNIVWAPNAWQPLVFTRDRGRNWMQGRAQGSGAPLVSWHLSNARWPGRVLAANRVSPNTFYHYAFGQIHRSEDGGENWVRIFDNPFSPNGVQLPLFAIETSLVCHPMRRDEIWMTARHNDNDPRLYPAFRSVDGGYTWDPVPDVVSGNAMGFGLGVGGVIDVYLHGQVRVGGQIEEGLFISSLDSAAGSWRKISSPANAMPSVHAVHGDLREPGVVYVATMGRGVFVGRQSRLSTTGH